jgi:hypothetical protein
MMTFFGVVAVDEEEPDSHSVDKAVLTWTAGWVRVSSAGFVGR